MKQNAAVATLKQIESQPASVHHETKQEGPNAAVSCYARDLRVLGQIVEGYSVSALHVREFLGGYQICALQTTSNPEAHRFITRLFQPRSCNQKSAGKRKSMGGLVKCELTVQDIEVAEALYRKFRQNSHDVPAPYRLSQILRGVGFFLDSKEARLKTLSFENDNISLVYQDGHGKSITIEENSTFFYEHWLKMSERRGNRRNARS